MTELGQKMVAAARSYIGVKFFHAGRNKNGLDCIGLLVLSAKDAGVDIPDETSYSQWVNTDNLKDKIDLCCRRLQGSGEVQPGDMVLFNIVRSPQHMAMVTEVGTDGPTRIVHSYQSVGRVVEHDFDAHWSRRVVGWYRLEVGKWRP